MCIALTCYSTSSDMCRTVLWPVNTKRNEGSVADLVTRDA